MSSLATSSSSHPMTTQFSKSSGPHRHSIPSSISCSRRQRRNHLIQFFEMVRFSAQTHDRRSTSSKLVDEGTPHCPRQKLVQAGKQVLNLASCNSTGLAGNETIKMRAIETLRKYGIVNLLDLTVLLVCPFTLNSLPS